MMKPAKSLLCFAFLASATAAMAQTVNYFPLETGNTWMFRFTGEMQWTGVRDESLDFEPGGTTRISGSWPVLDDHALVRATTSLPETLHESLDGFDLGGLLPYDGRYLADWPAETYDITLEDASRMARRIVLATIRTKVQEQLEGIRDLEIHFGRAAVDAYWTSIPNPRGSHSGTACGRSCRRSETWKRGSLAFPAFHRSPISRAIPSLASRAYDRNGSSASPPRRDP